MQNINLTQPTARVVLLHSYEENKIEVIYGEPKEIRVFIFNNTSGFINPSGTTSNYRSLLKELINILEYHEILDVANARDIPINIVNIFIHVCKQLDRGISKSQITDERQNLIIEYPDIINSSNNSLANSNLLQTHGVVNRVSGVSSIVNRVSGVSGVSGVATNMLEEAPPITSNVNNQINNNQINNNLLLRNIIYSFIRNYDPIGQNYPQINRNYLVNQQHENDDVQTDNVQNDNAQNNDVQNNDVQNNDVQTDNVQNDDVQNDDVQTYSPARFRFEHSALHSTYTIPDNMESPIEKFKENRRGATREIILMNEEKNAAANDNVTIPSNLVGHVVGNVVGNVDDRILPSSKLAQSEIICFNIPRTKTDRNNIPIETIDVIVQKIGGLIKQKKTIAPRFIKPRINYKKIKNYIHNITKIWLSRSEIDYFIEEINLLINN